MSKIRLSATVDADLIQAAEQAVRRGQAATVSAWLNDAMRLKIEHEQRLQALSEFIADYEKEHGEITRADMLAAARRARARALVVRGRSSRRSVGGSRA